MSAELRALLIEDHELGSHRFTGGEISESEEWLEGNMASSWQHVLLLFRVTPISYELVNYEFYLKGDLP